MIKIADFLIQELSKLGIKHFFGLPGDFCFNIIAAVQNNPKTQWIGCTNELNAGYAADGYARLNGYGALITTYNVGELSALNAIGGCMAENIPVIHIVGTPKTEFIQQNAIVHHNFSEPDYYSSLKAYSNYTEAFAFIDASNAKSEIERIISVLIKTKRPVYISIPMDVCNEKIKNDPQISIPESNQDTLSAAIEQAMRIIESSKSPVILADTLIKRFGCENEIREFSQKSNIPAVSMMMGKGILNENSDNFMGTYLASFANKDVYLLVNNSDCVICAGTIFCDFNTLKFDINLNKKKTIEIQGTSVKIADIVYQDVSMKDFLKLLSERVKKYDLSIIKNNPQIISEESTELKFSYLSEKIQKFLKPSDCVFTETGTSNFFLPLLSFPDGFLWESQLLWSSIGWAAPAMFGAMLADNNRRMILFTGEGSHQLTFQCMSNILHHNLKPIIFVLNNGGYTVERIISKDINNQFNEIIPWDYTNLVQAFGGSSFCAKIKTRKGFDDLLLQIEEENKTKLCYIELFMDKTEIPYLMKKMYDYKS